MKFCECFNKTLKNIKKHNKTKTHLKKLKIYNSSKQTEEEIEESVNNALARVDEILLTDGGMEKMLNGLNEMMNLGGVEEIEDIDEEDEVIEDNPPKQTGYIIDTIYNDIINGDYTIKKTNNKELPEKEDIKNLLIYYINYIYYDFIEDDLFVELTDYVVIPKNKIEIVSMFDYIEFIRYIKYNIDNKDILLN